MVRSHKLKDTLAGDFLFRTGFGKPTRLRRYSESGTDQNQMILDFLLEIFGIHEQFVAGEDLYFCWVFFPPIRNKIFF